MVHAGAQAQIYGGHYPAETVCQKTFVLWHLQKTRVILRAQEQSCQPQSFNQNHLQVN